MHVADILNKKGREVVTIDSERTVSEAIRMLNAHHVGAVVVTDDHGKMIGILTERDVLRECGERCTHLERYLHPGGHSCPAMVKDVMATDVIIGVPSDDVLYVMAVMTKNRIRHLPILDGGDLAGIVSIGDVVHAQVEEAEFENRMLKDYVQGATY